MSEQLPRETSQNHHRKTNTELRYTISPTYFDLQGEIINSFWPNSFSHWEKGQDRIRVWNKTDGIAEALVVTPKSFIYSLEGIHEQRKFIRNFNRYFKMFLDFKIANIFVRVGVRTFTCYYQIAFNDTINRSNKMFSGSGLLETIGENFTYEDFAITLEGQGNRLLFGAMKEGEKHAELNHFDLLQVAPEDLFYVDSDYYSGDISGEKTARDKIRLLLKRNIIASKNLSNFFKNGD